MRTSALLDNQAIMVTLCFKKRLEKEEKRLIFAAMKEHFDSEPIGILRYTFVPEEGEHTIEPYESVWTSAGQKGNNLPYIFRFNPIYLTRKNLEDAGILKRETESLRQRKNFITPNEVSGKMDFEKIQQVNIENCTSLINEICYRVRGFVVAFLPNDKKNKMVVSILKSEACIDTYFNLSSELLTHKERMINEYEAIMRCQSKNIVRHYEPESVDQFYYLVENPQYDEKNNLMKPFIKAGAFYNKTTNLLRFENIYNMEGSQARKRKFKLPEIDLSESFENYEYNHKSAEKFYKEHLTATEDLYNSMNATFIADNNSIFKTPPAKKGFMDG